MSRSSRSSHCSSPCSPCSANEGARRVFERKRALPRPRARLPRRATGRHGSRGLRAACRPPSRVRSCPEARRRPCPCRKCRGGPCPCRACRPSLDGVDDPGTRAATPRCGRRRAKRRRLTLHRRRQGPRGGRGTHGGTTRCRHRHHHRARSARTRRRSQPRRASLLVRRDSARRYSTGVTRRGARGRRSATPSTSSCRSAGR